MTSKRKKYWGNTPKFKMARGTRTSSNRFQILSDVEDEEISSLENAATRETNTKIPPIVVDINHNFTSLITLIGTSCKYKRISIGTKLMPNSTNDYDEIVKKLNAENIHFFTHPIKDNKHFKLMLFGLPQIGADLIKKEFKEAFNIELVNIKEIVTTRSNLDDALYMLEFDRNQISKREVVKIKYVYGIVVHWRNPHRRPRGPTQCSKCTMYGHGSANCFRAAACMGCGEPHDYSQCQLNKAQIDGPFIYKCFNCIKRNLKNVNHRADDPQCPSRREYLDIRKRVTNKTQPIRLQRTNETFTSDDEEHTPRWSGVAKSTNAMPGKKDNKVTYASMARSKHGTQQNDNLSNEQILNIYFEALDALEKFMHWNAQGITTPTSILELEQVLIEKQIDIILMNETFLKQNHNFKLTNYKVYRNDRISHGGGVLIAVKKTIPHERIPIFTTAKMENISIIIKVNNRPIRFTSVYCPKYTNDFYNDLNILTDSTTDYFIFGDLNAQHTSWGCGRNNSAGSSLYNHQLDSQYYVYSPNSFTRFGQTTNPTQPSVVDLLLTNSNLHFSQLETHPELLHSDHTPITCTIYGSIVENVINIHLYKKANWKEIGKWIDDKIRNNNLHTEVLTETNIEQFLFKLTHIVQEASGQIPVGSQQVWQRKLSGLTLFLIGQRKRYRRKLQRSRNNSERMVIISLLKQLTKLINHHIANDRNNSWNQFLQKLPPGSKKFWKLAKAMKGNKPNVLCLTTDGAEVFNNKEKAEIIAEVFENYHKTTYNMPSLNERKVMSHIEWLKVQRVPDNLRQDLTTVDEVKYFIRGLKNSKAPGIDGINAIMLKNLTNTSLAVITKIFNWCLANGYFPKQFKLAKVIPILKPGKDAKSPNSYRPISMLNCLDKVFEKIILSRLNDYTENNNIVQNVQFGFRKEHSTVHQVKRIVNFIQTNKNKRKSTGVVLLDIEKAFDSIWHNGLIFKLNKFGYPIYLQKIIQSFLRERSFVVSIENETSSQQIIPAGVPQGSVLSPTLYAIFISDFKILRDHDAALYADDTAIIAKGKVSNALVKKMGKALQHAQNYFMRWKIKINEAKTQAIIFPYNKSPKRVPTLPLCIEGVEIPVLDTVKYLGITLDKKLIFRHHILQSCEKAIRCGRALFPLLNRRSSLNRKNKILLYKMCIRPIMTYGCQIWSKWCAKTHIKKLQVIQNKNLKIIFNLPKRYSTSTLHRNNNQVMFETIISELTKRFDDRNRSSRYDLIRNL